MHIHIPGLKEVGGRRVASRSLVSEARGIFRSWVRVDGDGDGAGVG